MAVKKVNNLVLSGALCCLIVAGIVFFTAGRSFPDANMDGKTTTTFEAKPAESTAMKPANTSARSEIVRAQGLIVHEPQGLSPDQVTDEHIFSMLRAARPDLVLSDTETTVFAAAIVDFLRVSSLLKADSATVTRGANGELEIRVPSRPELAEEFSGMLMERLVEDLSAKRAHEIVDRLGTTLVAVFSGYGAAEERILLTPSASSPGTYDFRFLANIPEDLLNQRRRSLLRNYAGDGEGGTSVPLESIISRPKYAYLARFVQSAKSAAAKR